MRRPGVFGGARWRHALLALCAIMVSRRGYGRAIVLAAGSPGSGGNASGLSSLPASARGVVSAALGADSASYRVRASGQGFAAANAAQGMGISFGASGVLIASRGLRVGVSLRSRRLRNLAARRWRGGAGRAGESRDLRARRTDRVVSKRPTRPRAGLHDRSSLAGGSLRRAADAVDGAVRRRRALPRPRRTERDAGQCRRGRRCAMATSR